MRPPFQQGSALALPAFKGNSDFLDALGFPRLPSYDGKRLANYGASCESLDFPHLVPKAPARPGLYFAVVYRQAPNPAQLVRQLPKSPIKKRCPGATCRGCWKVGGRPARRGPPRPRGARHSVLSRERSSQQGSSPHERRYLIFASRLLGRLPEPRLMAHQIFAPDSTVARMPPRAPARCRTQCYSRAVHSSPPGAARKVRRDSRPAINFNSWFAPIMTSRSTQASMVRAFFMATSNTCVRLSIIASPRIFRRRPTTRQPW